MVNFDVLETNIIVIPAVPLRQIPNPSMVLEAQDFQHLFHKPFTVTQGLIIDNNVAIPSFSFESMRSQKSITLSASRIEIHDRSGNPDLKSSDLPELAHLLFASLNIIEIKDVGANCVYTFPLDGNSKVTQYIADKFFIKELDFLPQDSRLSGASVRLFLTGRDDLEHTIAIEPVNGDVNSSNIFISCNSHRSLSEIPDMGGLNDIFQECVTTSSEFAEKLFSA